MFFTLTKKKTNPAHKMSNPRPVDPGHGLMLALEPRLLFDAAGLVAGLDLIQGPDSAAHDTGSFDTDGFDPALGHSADQTPPGPAHLDGAEDHAHAPGYLDGFHGGIHDGADQAISSLIFIDTGVKNYQDLIEDIPDNTLVILLDSGNSGMDQITQAISQYQDLESIHIVSHGSSGSITLGDMVLSNDTIDQYADMLAAWRDNLSDGADILIYGCNVADGMEGQTFVAQLADITGADVAASNDPTGASDLGGDWDLEVHQGLIDHDVAVAFAGRESFDGLLDNIEVTNTNDAGTGSLRQAVSDAYDDGDTISFNSSLNGQTITLTSGPIVFQSDVTIDNDGITTPGDDGTPDVDVVISGDYSCGVFVNPYGHTVTLDGVTIQYGFAANFGGVRNDGTLTIEDSTISNNVSQRNGGGIYNTGTLTISNSTISDNGAFFSGGGIYTFDGTADIDHSTISSNFAAFGGGIYNLDGTVNLKASTISGNYAYSSGGGICNVGEATIDASGNYTFSGTANIDHSTISSNEAVYGGGIYNLDGTVNLKASAISANYAYFGGGILNDGQLKIYNYSEISNNSAYRVLNTHCYGGYGGGIFNGELGDLRIYDSTITGNNTAIDPCVDYSSGESYGGYGGGLANEGSASIYRSKISGNTAYWGGGLANQGTLKVNQSTISSNYAANNGGGFFNGGFYFYDDQNYYMVMVYGETTVDNSTISGNDAANAGGGVFNNYYANFKITNSTISGNEATNAGDGVYNGNEAHSYFGAYHSTIAYNGTGIHNAGDGVINIGHTIVADDIVTGGGTTAIRSTIAVNSVAVGPTGITSHGYNLFTQSSVDGANTSLHDILGGTADLKTLADNGGPTLTHALGENSDARGAGDPSLSAGTTAPDYDQRGIARISSDGVIDIGAVESQIPVANDDSDTTNEDTAITLDVLANDTDADPGETLAVTSFDDTGTTGLVTNNGDGTFTYDPNGQSNTWPWARAPPTPSHTPYPMITAALTLQRSPSPSPA